MTRSIGPAAMLSIFVACSIGCTEGDPASSLSGTSVHVEIDELEAFTDCDPAGNPDGGDFYITAAIEDWTAGRRLLEVFNDELVQTWTGRVEIDDLDLAGLFRHEAGRSVYFAVGFNEFDGGSSYDGSIARAHRYDWDDDDACWLGFVDDDCVRPGESRAFEIDLVDDEGPIFCEATLRYDVHFDRVSRSAAAYAAGLWEGSTAQLTIDRGDATSATIWICPDILTGVLVDPDAEDEIAGAGTCRAGWLSDRELDYELTARFVSDTRIRGEIAFTGDGETRVLPIEGTRELDTMRLVFSERDVEPIGFITGPATWSGVAVLERVE